MEVVRNIQVKLDVSEDDHEVLDETFEQFRQAAQHVADHGWDDNPYEITDTKNTLHDETYSDIRDELSLQSSLVQSARNLAATALGNCKDRIIEDGQKASTPEFKGTVVVYNDRTVTYNDDHVSLATVSDRVTAEYVTPVDDGGTPFEDYWTDEWEKAEATLHKLDGTYYLHVAVKKDVEPSCDEESENGVVLGVISMWTDTSPSPAQERSSVMRTILTIGATNTNVVVEICNGQPLGRHTSQFSRLATDSLAGVVITCTGSPKQSSKKPWRTTARRLRSRI